MQSKIFSIIILSLLLGCSSDKEIDTTKYIPVYENSVNFNFVDEKDKNNSQLAAVTNIKNIYKMNKATLKSLGKKGKKNKIKNNTKEKMFLKKQKINNSLVK